MQNVNKIGTRNQQHADVLSCFRITQVKTNAPFVNAIFMLHGWNGQKGTPAP